uniref:non-specific serine/threonine protein kinase n=1 Tax=Solanum tuberosum TaxID=4113 RepID=M1CJH3_SOLTU
MTSSGQKCVTNESRWANMVEEEEEHVTPHSKLIPGAPTFVPKGSSIAYVSSPLHWGRQLILAGSNVQKVYVSDKELIDALWGSNVERLLVLIFALMEKAFTFFLLTILLLPHYVMAQTNITTDQLALLSFKSQISSDPFHFLNESWSPAISVCRWVGVICGSRHQRVKSLKLSNFALTGRIPRDFGNLTFLVSLDLGNNHFHGNLPQEMAHLRRLKFLDLSIVPEEIGNLVNLVDLSVENNQITGSIPISIFNISSLQSLLLWGNNLSGFLPREIGNLTKMQFLNLKENRFTGEIPKDIRNLVELEEFDVGFNSFSGSLPMEIFNISQLRTIQLSDNNLSGTLPPNIGSTLPNIEILYLHTLTNLVGTIPHSISNCSKLTDLELSQNKLSGLIPNSLGYLTHLNFLNLWGNNLTSDSFLSFLTSLTNCRNLLRHNKLQGSIPDSMRNMVGLEFLDLSHNNITGIIPMSLEKLQYLKYFNVSDNKLYGEIPSGGPFKNLSSQFFIDNEALCGSSRFSVPRCPTSSKHRSNRKQMFALFLMLGIALVFVPIAFVFVWIRYRRGKRVPQRADSLSIATTERISYYELLQATDSLSESTNLIGSGSFGSVYKGVLRSGTAIAVKVFNLQLEAAFKSLVLEYMPNGSLDKYLYSHNYFLDIRQRLSIMIDVACTLEYLHHGCSLPVIHCDLKPSNVLLDEDVVAHLSDFGISKLLGEDESDLYTKTLATFGYIAPEYGMDGLVSLKCDVYCYGIMLLETFTRRKPSDFEGDLSLKQWVSYSLPEAVMDVVDANLITVPMDNCLQKELDVVASIMKVALDCCAESPARRTNMKDVVGMLQKIKIQLLTC